MLVSAPLFITSGVTCGCEPDAYNIADQMHIFEYPGERVSSAAENLARGQRAFLGRDIYALPLHQTALDKECKFVETNELHCEFWNEVGVLYSSGRFVTVRAGASGKVERVTVASLSKFIGVTLNRPNNAFQPTPSARLN